MRFLIEEELYKKIVEKMALPTSDVLFFDESLTKILLFLRNNRPAKNEYYSVGGRIRKGESSLESAVNSVKDETGMDFSPDELDPIGIIDEMFPDSFFDENVSTHNINHYFALTLGENSEIKMDIQHSKFGWFDVEDQNLHPYMKEKIKKSLEFYNCHGKKR